MMQHCIRDDDGGRWVRSYEGAAAPLPGHGATHLEQHRDLLETLRDRDVVMLLEEDDKVALALGVDGAIRQVPAHRHRFYTRVRYGAWLWIVWQVGGDLVADSKIEWVDDAPEFRPVPAFARAPFVDSPHPKGRP